MIQARRHGYATGPTSRYLSRTTSHHCFHCPHSRCSHGRLLDRRYSPQNHQRYCLPPLPRFQHLHRCLPQRHILPWQRNLHHPRTLGFPHLVPNPHSPPRHHHLSILPPWQTCYHRRNFLETSSPRCSQRCIREFVGHPALYHRSVAFNPCGTVLFLKPPSPAFVFALFVSSAVTVRTL